MESQAAGPPRADTARGAEDHGGGSTIQPHGPTQTEDHCLYSTVQPHGSGQTADLQAEEDEVQYVTVYHRRPGDW